LPPSLPKGYDSIYLEGESTSEKGVYQHKYAIYSQNYIQLCYQVNCKIKIELSNAYADMHTCESCKDVVATEYCIDDKAYFCHDCDEKLHNISRDNQVF